MATHSSILAWRIPWPEEPGGLQSIALQRDGHGTNEHAHCSSKVLLGLFLKVHGKKKKFTGPKGMAPAHLTIAQP